MLLLAIIAWVMLRYSRKLPITQFFAYSSILIAILAVVLAGKGEGALQEAGMIPITLVPGGPRNPLLGVAPPAEPLGARLVTLLIVIFGFRSSGRTSEAAACPAEYSAAPGPWLPPRRWRRWGASGAWP